MGGLFSRNNRSTRAEDPANQQQEAGAGDGATAKPAQELGSEPPIKELEYSEIVESIATGDLAVLYRDGWKQPHFAVLVQHPQEDPDFPLLLVKGKSKPLPLDKFDKTLGREAHTTSAINRIFYGDYVKVHVRHILTNDVFPIDKVVENVEKVQEIPFSEYELEAIEKAESPDARSALVSALMVAHFYQLMPVSSGPLFDGDPAQVTPNTLQNCLKLSAPEGIKLPATKPGPLATGEAPWFDRIV